MHVLWPISFQKHLFVQSTSIFQRCASWRGCKSSVALQRLSATASLDGWILPLLSMAGWLHISTHRSFQNRVARACHSSPLYYSVTLHLLPHTTSQPSGRMWWFPYQSCPFVGSPREPSILRVSYSHRGGWRSFHDRPMRCAGSLRVDRTVSIH